MDLSHSKPGGVGAPQVHWDRALQVCRQLVQAVDPLAVVVYDERAVVIDRTEIDELCWAFVYGSNLADGLRLSRTLLDGPGVIHAVVYSTPTSYTVDSNVRWWLEDDRGLVATATLEVAQGCAADGIVVNFVLIGEFAGSLPQTIATMTAGRVTVHDDGAGSDVTA